MNQFFYQIIREASALINSDDYRRRNITKQTAFTRNRKLTFPVMIVLLLILNTNKSVDKKSAQKSYTQIFAQIFYTLFNWCLVLIFSQELCR